MSRPDGILSEAAASFLYLETLTAAERATLHGVLAPRGAVIAAAPVQELDWGANDIAGLRRYNISEATAFTMDPTNLAGVYWFTVEFNGYVLQAISLPGNWTAMSGSEQFDNPLKSYLVQVVVFSPTRVAYKVTGVAIVDESQFTEPPIILIGDHGEDSDPGHAAVATYALSLNPSDVYLAGDVNYPAGSAATIDSNTAAWNSLIATHHVWPAFGNHDLDTIALNFTSESTPMALWTVWKYSSSSSAFTSDWKTNAATFAGWTNVGGEVGKVPGFGESDSTTTPAVANDSGISYYFAKVLNLASAPPAGKKLRLTMYIDDGAQVFINGVMVYEFNVMHPVSDTSLAFFAVSAGTSETTDTDRVWAERRLHTILVDGSFLQAGDNIIAAHLHQAAASSTDLSWDMSIEVGTSTDVVPAKTDPVPFTNGYGQPLRNKFSYVPSGCVQYVHSPNAYIDVIVVNDGIRSDGRMTDPRWFSEEGGMAQWCKARIEASTKPFQIVVCHRPFFSVNEGGSDRHNTELDWSFLKTNPGVLLFNGHNHQTLAHRHSSGLYIINASNVGRQDGLDAYAGSSTGLTSEYADADPGNHAVAVVQASTNMMRVQLRKVSNGAVLHTVVISAP